MASSKPEEGKTKSVGAITSSNRAVIRVCTIGKWIKSIETERRDLIRHEDSKNTSTMGTNRTNDISQPTPGSSGEVTGTGNPWDKAKATSSPPNRPRRR